MQIMNYYLYGIAVVVLGSGFLYIHAKQISYYSFLTGQRDCLHLIGFLPKLQWENFICGNNIKFCQISTVEALIAINPAMV